MYALINCVLISPLYSHILLVPSTCIFHASNLFFDGLTYIFHMIWESDDPKHESNVSQSIHDIPSHYITIFHGCATIFHMNLQGGAP